MSYSPGDVFTADDANLLAAPPHCFVYQSSVTATSSSLGPVDMDAEQSDPLGWHNPASNPSRVTPTIAGWYHVVGGVAFAANTTGYRLVQLLHSNGNRIAEQRSNTASTSVAWVVNVAGYAYFNGTTDYVVVAALQNSGGSLNTIAGLGLTFLQVQYVGE